MDNTKNKFSIVREYKATKTEVFEAFASAEALAQWWGPIEAPIDVIHLDFKPNGIFHYRMKGNPVTYGIFKYINIDRPNTISWINSFADENGRVIKPPFEGMDIPKEILNTISLEENNGRTVLSLVAEPVNAAENEIETFNSIIDSMEQGYGGTLGQLEEYLKNNR